MRVGLTISVAIISFCTACTNQETKQANPRLNTSVFSNNFIPEIDRLDSVELIYYKEKDKPRYFTYLPSTDTALIRLIKENVMLLPEPGNRCSKEGKIYCFADGNIFTSLHFAYSEDSCNLLTFMKNGNNYILPLSSSLEKALLQHRPAAREPIPAGN